MDKDKNQSLCDLSISFVYIVTVSLTHAVRW